MDKKERGPEPDGYEDFLDDLSHFSAKYEEKYLADSIGKAPSEAGSDFSFIVYPLPKIALCYIFYEADDDFPASVTCLYSNNANQFMPVDGLADVGEYTSRKILNLID